jgi:hypothetical protein
MIDGLDLTAEVLTVAGGGSGGMSMGGGSGSIMLTRTYRKDRGLFRNRTETIGTLKAALCPDCGAVVLYADINNI